MHRIDIGIVACAEVVAEFVHEAELPDAQPRLTTLNAFSAFGPIQEYPQYCALSTKRLTRSAPYVFRSVGTLSM